MRILRMKMKMKRLGPIAVLLAAAPSLFVPHPVALAEEVVTAEELAALISDLRGTDPPDERLMRWDATDHTKGRQEGGACARLPAAAAALVGGLDGGVDEELKRLACEYATWCITDNPKQRAVFAEQEGAHAAVVKLVGSKSPEASVAAGHLVYIASFADGNNHQAFVREGAVPALADVVLRGKASPAQEMWAMAALQNLAASYCGTEALVMQGEVDGRCRWDWRAGDDGAGHELAIDGGSLPLLSEGAGARHEALKISGLVEALRAHVCRGPVQKDHNSALTGWAAAGALKNLALDKGGREQIEAGNPFECYCAFQHSVDWLEKLKGTDLLRHLRGHNPCWYDDAGLCIDELFLDEQGDRCDEYEHEEHQHMDCDLKDAITGRTARQACCGCGGGMRVSKTHDEL